jgi:subtilisin-like proprotein convertase family protein
MRLSIARIGFAVVALVLLLLPAAGQAFISSNPVNDPNASTDQAFGSAGEQMAPSLAVLGSNVVSAWDDNGSAAGFVGYANSANGGDTFSDRGDPSAGALHEPDADPIVDTNDTTGAFYMTTPSTQPGEDVQLLKSTDNGVTFGSPVNVRSGHEGDTDNFLGEAHFAIDNFAGAPNGNVDVCFQNFNVISEHTDEILFNRSTNGGAGFGAHPTLISTGGAGCFVAVGPDHSVYVFYYRGTGDLGLTGPSALYVRRSTDRGQTFRPEHVVAILNTTADGGDLQLNNTAQTLAYPHAAINPVSGDLVVAYNDDPNLSDSADNADVFYVASEDNGNTWSAPVRVNDDTVRDQYEPSVAISPDGTRIMLAYYSTSHDSHNLIAHRRARTGVVNVGSGQITLRRSFQIGADTPIDSEFARFGEQDGIDATDSDFHTDWSDARLGSDFATNQSDIWYARIPTSTANSQVINITTDLGSSSPPPTVGESVDMQLSVTNSCCTAARDVFVSVPAVTGVIYEPTPGSDCWAAGGFLSCNLHDIPPSGTHQVHFDAFATKAGVRTVTATATTADRETNVSDNKESEAFSVSNGPATTLTYSSGNVSAPIPDSSSVDIPINVPTVRRALDVDAVVRLDHTFDGDVVLTLISPSGRQVLLSDRNGGSGDNYGTGANSCAGTGTTFNDSAATSITAGAAPFSGSFIPERPLSNLIGEQSSGTWKLRVTDAASQDTGTVGCVKLKIRGAA